MKYFRNNSNGIVECVTNPDVIEMMTNSDAYDEIDASEKDLPNAVTGTEGQPETVQIAPAPAPVAPAAPAIAEPLAPVAPAESVVENDQTDEGDADEGQPNMGDY